MEHDDDVLLLPSPGTPRSRFWDEPVPQVPGAVLRRPRRPVLEYTLNTLELAIGSPETGIQEYREQGLSLGQRLVYFTKPHVFDYSFTAFYVSEIEPNVFVADQATFSLEEVHELYTSLGFFPSQSARASLPIDEEDSF